MIETIIIPVLGRHDLLERCLRSLSGRVNNLLIIDNGNDLDALKVRAWVPQNVQNVHIWNMPCGLSVAGSWNLGVKATPFSAGWLLLNADAWFEEGAFDVFSSGIGDDIILTCGSPAWCCAWIGSEVVRRVGLFCERYHPAYMEDIDYETRARRLGVEVVQSPAIVHHENSSTIASNDHYRSRNDQTHRQNLEYFNERWRGVDGDAVPPHADWDLNTRIQQGWDS